MRVSKSFTFDAAHRLQKHDGKCRNLHGHTYQVDVVISSTSLYPNGPKQGMVIDFGDLSTWWKRLEPSLDHVTLLEDSDPLVDALRGLTPVITFPWPPTAENLAEWIKVDLTDYWLGTVRFGLYASAVRVHETAKTWAEA